MGFLDFFKRKKKVEKEEVKSEEVIKCEEIMTRFAEGHMTVYEFWEEFNNNKDLQNVIYNDEKLPKKGQPFLYKDLDLSKLYIRDEIFRVVKCYFMRRNIELNFYSYDREEISRILDITMEYVDCYDQWFVDNIYNKCPVEYNLDEKMKFIETKMKEYYKCKDKTPQWLQSPAWPIVNNKPAVFVKQSVSLEEFDDDWEIFEIKYYFVDENNNEIIVEQYT